MIGNGRVEVKNILQSFQKEKSYFISANKFKFYGIKVGPLPQGKKLKLKICNFVNAFFLSLLVLVVLPFEEPWLKILIVHSNKF